MKPAAALLLVVLVTSDVNAQPSYGEACKDTHLVYVGPCEFKIIGSDEILTCAEGTAMDRTTCMCIRDDQGVCPTATTGPPCQTKYQFNFRERRFQLTNQTEDPSFDNADDFRQSFQPVDLNVPLYYLYGQDFGFQPVSLKVRFSLRSNQTAATILSSSFGCNGLQLELTVEPQNQMVMVTLRDKGEQIRLEGSVEDIANITVGILFNLKDRQFVATADGANLISVGNPAVALAVLDAEGVDTTCLLEVGPFDGEVEELSFWRGCPNLPV